LWRRAALERRPEIAVRQCGQIAAVLRPYRLIQAVGVLKVRQNFRRQRLLLIERPAGSCSNEKKADGDDDEQRRNRAGQPGQEIAEHSLKSID
jgi:hypothetical protein